MDRTNVPDSRPLTMSLFDDERYTWRETYFVLFDPERRPRLSSVQRELQHRVGSRRILDAKADEEGRFLSMTLASYEDHAALEIIYREGDDVLAETAALAATLEKGCLEPERQRLEGAKLCRARFVVLLFEKTAGTGAFKIVKVPELRFAPLPHVESDAKTPPKPQGQGGFPKGQVSGKLVDKSNRPSRPKYHFDPDSYENCKTGGVELNNDFEFRDPAEDSSILERVDPNTLVLVLEILSRATHGIAIDPAGGVLI